MTVGEHPGSPYRVGLLLDDRQASKVVHEFVQWAQAHEGLRITHLILTPGKSAGDDASPSVRARVMFAAVTAIERLLLARSKRYRDHRARYNLSPLITEVVQLGIGRDDDIRRVMALELDLLVAFADAPPAREIAKAARLGVLSICFGRLTGFWPAYDREDTTEFVIRHINGNGDKQTLLRGRVATQFYFLLNQAALCEKASYYLKTTIKKIATAGQVPATLAAAPESDRPAAFPSAHQMSRYLGSLCWRVGVKAVQKVLSLDYRWHVAFVQAEWKNAVLWRAPVHTIKNPSGRYLADPFVVSKNGKRTCFVEDYDLANSRGRISAYELGGDAASFIGVALEESFHLSFPYVFEYRGDLYMCPESSESRDIRIYKCVDFPLRWTLEKVIMKNVSAVDTMLFERGGKWWMLTNIDPAELGDFQLELHIFSASSPLDEQWTPHPQNPTFVDASRARNAGLLRDGDRLFRVAQGQGFDFYGKSTSINEIVRIDPNNYEENRVCDVTPTFQRGIAGTHHMHSDGTLTVLDFARLGRMA